jgi:hypothetical protein
MKDQKYKPAIEWFLQADYDIKTDDVKLSTGKYIYDSSVKTVSIILSSAKGGIKLAQIQIE